MEHDGVKEAKKGKVRRREAKTEKVGRGDDSPEGRLLSPLLTEAVSVPLGTSPETDREMPDGLDMVGSMSTKAGLSVARDRTRRRLYAGLPSKRVRE